MISPPEYISKQYWLVRDSRRVLFDYCNTVRPEDFVNQNTSFGRGGSMRNLLVHIAHTYQHWIGNTALKRNLMFAGYEEFPTVQQVRDLYEEVDELMRDFISSELVATDLNNAIAYKLEGVERHVTSLELFSHVITHEYHHKGQVLSISRHLGYTPVDTDIIR